jgi:formate/nitrite transporter FocA (FNT family)
MAAGRRRPRSAHAPDPVLDLEPIHIGERGADVGAERLARSPLDILVTGVIGGIEVFFGGLVGAAALGAMLDLPAVHLYTALLVAGLLFPAGFAFVVLGRSELFTENFLIPVAAVVQGRAPLRRLGSMWGLAWLGNMTGCAAMAALVNVPHGVGDPVLSGYAHYAAYKLGVPALGTFVSGVLAGAVMTVLTWLMLSVRNSVAKLLLIWAAGYTIFVANLAHVVLGAALVFAGFPHTTHGWADVAGWVGLATAGNLAGGLGFVTLFRLVQVWEKGRSG